MGDSSGSVSIDIEMIPLAGKECFVQTSKGPISVFICGDREKPPLITYPDVALNYMSCFQGLLLCPDASAFLLHNFCIYHIDPPGHELGAAVISSEVPTFSVNDLADQVAEIVDFFGLEQVIGLGVTAGAYILTLFATKYKERVLGLILVSPLCKAPSWTEWLYNKIILSLLHFYGMCSVVKESLLYRYFSKDIRFNLNGSESDIVLACRRFLDERQGSNVTRMLQAINERPDLTDNLKKLQCKTLVLVGERSPFHSDAIHMNTKMDRSNNPFVEIQMCGSLVTEEQPHAMVVPIELFLAELGFHNRYSPSTLWSSCSLSSQTCISSELLSAQSIGIKLKPIRTRVLNEFLNNW